MLIIGQPKSASTSLMVTIAKILKKGYREGVPKKGINKELGYEVLQECHRNINLRSKEYLQSLIQGNRIFKEHLLPIKEHIDILKEINQNVVVLLRNPEDSCDSYTRQFNSNKNKHTDRDQLKKDLKKFNKDWKKVKEDFILFVDYEDLVLKYNETMDEILTHLGCGIKEIIPLEKVRYTGIGESRILERELKKDNTRYINLPKVEDADKLKENKFVSEEGETVVINSPAEECIDESIKDDSTDITD